MSDRQTIKRKGLGFLIIILLIGCQRDELFGPPTVVTIDSSPTQVVGLPTETAVPLTHTPPAPKEITTAEPTITPTPTEVYALPTLPPVAEEAGKSADLYQLRPWSEAEAASLVSLMSEYAEEIGDLPPFYGDLGRKEIIETGREFILRYPDSPYRTKVEWQMVDASTYYPYRSLDEMLAKLIEADLNANNATLETLDTYLQPYGFQVGLNDCPGCLSFPTSIPNLLGDGREVFLLIIERTTSVFHGGALIAIWQDADKGFTAAPIVSQWAAMTRFSGGISNFETRHITGDSQPELIIELWGHSGSMPGSSLHMYRWNGQQFVPLAGTPFNFSGGVFADEWNFVEGDDPSRLQIVRPYYGMTTFHEWTGTSYETVGVTIKSVPPSLTDKYWVFDWIQQEIERSNYNEVIAYIEEALQKPTSHYKPFGAEYHHAMRFVLGMNYVYLGDEEMARSVFETLHQEALSSELIGFSQAATAFLDHFDDLGSAYEACTAAYKAIKETGLALEEIASATPLCAFDKLFVAKLNQYDGRGDIFDDADAAELIYSQQLNLNGDEQLDWLVAISHPTLQNHTIVEVWAILQTDVGAETIMLTKLRSEEEPGEGISVESYPLLPGDMPLIAILLNNSFRLLQLREEETWKAMLHSRSIMATDYTLQFVDNHLQLDLFIDASLSYTDVERITYWWDAEMATFIKVSRYASNSLGVPFTEALDSAENLIFENGDFAAAIPILTAIVAEFDADNHGYISLPKTLYLLGLAHEMQGNEALAVAAYWQLWHDHPDNPYALMAVAKLEEK